MVKFVRLVVATLSLLLVLLPAQAAEADESIVVVGTRIPVNLEKFAGAATIITARNIELNQYLDVTDALMSVPGLHVASSGGVGAQTSVFIRGTESNHTLVLIDGIEVTDPGSGGFAFEHLQLNDVEQIEVLRGPYSAQYGSEAIGGVINIITKRGSGTPKATARVEAGSFATKSGMSNLSGQYGDVDFSVGGAWLQTDGESLTPSRLRAGSKAERDAYDNFDAKISAGLRIDEDSRVDFNFGYVAAETDFDGDLPPFEQSSLTSSVYEKRYGVRWSGVYVDGIWQPSLRASRYERKLNTSGNSLQAERTKFEWWNDFFLSDAVKFVVGGETELEEIVVGSKNNARTNAFYMQMWLEPFDQLLLSGGWRHDDPDDFDSNRNWQASAAYDLGDSGMRLYASYGTAFKAPTLDDRFGHFGGFVYGNPKLNPEESRSWEVSVDQTFLVQSIASNITWDVTYFNNKIRNLIEYDFARSMNFNVASAHIEGLETAVSFDMLKGLNLHFDSTFMRAYDNDHSRLLRRPLRKATFEVRWVDNPTWFFSMKADYVGPWRDIKRDGNSVVSKSGYTLVGISARHKLDESLAFFARINNVFDREYEPVDGYAGRGIEFYGGIEINL